MFDHKKSKICAISFILLVLFAFGLSQIAQSETFGESLRRNGETAAENTYAFGRRTKSKLTDASISSSVKASLIADPVIEAYRIRVSTRKRMVYLRGNVPNRFTMLRAIMKTRDVYGVKGVVNLLAIDNS
jgi:osmotically-inducible protein OsmY